MASASTRDDLKRVFLSVCYCRREGDVFHILYYDLLVNQQEMDMLKTTHNRYPNQCDDKQAHRRLKHLVETKWNDSRVRKERPLSPAEIEGHPVFILRVVK